MKGTRNSRKTLKMSEGVRDKDCYFLGATLYLNILAATRFHKVDIHVHSSVALSYFSLHFPGEFLALEKEVNTT